MSSAFLKDFPAITTSTSLPTSQKFTTLSGNSSKQINALEVVLKNFEYNLYPNLSIKDVLLR